jgi:hypothetical protein
MVKTENTVRFNCQGDDKQSQANDRQKETTRHDEKRKLQPLPRAPGQGARWGDILHRLAFLYS